MHLLSKHLEYLFEHQDIFALAQEDSNEADENDVMRAAIQEIVAKGARHLSEVRHAHVRMLESSLTGLGSPNLE